MEPEVQAKKGKRKNEVISREELPIEGYIDRKLLIYTYKTPEGKILKRETIKKLKPKQIPCPTPPPPVLKVKKPRDSKTQRDKLRKEVREFIYSADTPLNDLFHLVDFIKLLNIGNDDTDSERDTYTGEIRNPHKVREHALPRMDEQSESDTDD